MGWKSTRGKGRNKKKFCAAEISEAQDAYWNSPVAPERETKLNLWIQNLITFEECFSNKPLEVILIEN